MSASSQPITFTTGNALFTTHLVEISTYRSELADIISIVGRFQPVNCSNIGSISCGAIDRLSDITIDGEQNIQGDQSKIDAVFDRVRRAIEQGTGSAVIQGKNLVILTGQSAGSGATGTAPKKEGKRKK